MFASNHVITGAVIGSIVASPVIALPVAFFTHFVLDAMPHFGLEEHKDKKFLYILSVDCGLAGAILLGLAILQPDNWPVIVAAGIACAAPDLMWFPRWIKEITGKKQSAMNAVERFHSKIQWAEREIWWGLASEVSWFCIMLVVLSQNLNF